MKKLLFLTSRLPYPPTSGRKNVMYYYCKYLHEKYNFDIINISFLEENDDTQHKPSFIKRTYVLDNPSGKIKLKNLIIETFFKKKYPMQVSLYYDANIKEKIYEIIKEEKPDIVMCDMVRTSEYLKDLNIPKILNLDDLISIRYERQLQSDLEHINPFGAYLYRLPNIAQKLLSNKLMKKFILNMETKLLKEYEINTAKQYDAVIFVAQKEAEELNKRINGSKAFGVPLGVDVDYFIKVNVGEKMPYSISFLGAMNVAHNETAAIHFCNDILPLIKQKVPQVKFYIIGGGVTDKINSLASESVIVTGRVEDVREYVVKTQVFVCPLLFGSGIKTKNLEAMVMNVPVVTTTFGAESIDAIDNKDWLIRDSSKDFADAVISILKDKDLQKDLAENGYQYVIKNFSWDIVSDKWKDVLRYMDKTS